MNNESVLHLGICHAKEVFESDRDEDSGPQSRVAVTERVSKGTYQRAVEIPPGTYAIKLHIAENKDEKLDTNSFGIPKEYYGISNNTQFLNVEAASFFSAPIKSSNKFVTQVNQ